MGPNLIGQCRLRLSCSVYWCWVEAFMASMPSFAGRASHFLVLKSNQKGTPMSSYCCAKTLRCSARRGQAKTRFAQTLARLNPAKPALLVRSHKGRGKCGCASLMPPYDKAGSSASAVSLFAPVPKARLCLLRKLGYRCATSGLHRVQHRGSMQAQQAIPYHRPRRADKPQAPPRHASPSRSV